jgi:hypothetical protein
MKKFLISLGLAALFVGGTLFAGKTALHTVSDFANRENLEKTTLVQERVQETISLLEDLSEDPYIRSKEHSYQEKAAYLTDKNQQENLGYMMLRILDEEIGVYREDAESSVSNLGSRDYMQKLYKTGEVQVTDAFLAGADGKTINYTVAVAIEEDSRVTGALFAAIYGEEIDGYLQDDRYAAHVLVGSQLQYMGGVTNDRFGLSVAQVLEGEYKTSRPVENILLDFNDKKSGSFWSLESPLEYIVYSPVDGADWVVMTQVRAIPLIQSILVTYGCGVAVLLISGCLLLRGKNRGKEAKDISSHI